MACNISSAISLPCIESAGGLQGTIWIATDFEPGTLTLASTTGATPQQVTAATGDDGVFFEFEVAKNVASFTENATVSQENGTLFFEAILTFNLQQMDSQKRYELLLLAKNRKISAIFQDQNNRYWLMGDTRGGVVTANAATSGVALPDLNGYTLTITSQEVHPAYNLAGAPNAIFTGCTFTAAA